MLFAERPRARVSSTKIRDERYQNDATHLKQIVALVVHPHLVGWMFLWTLAGICDVWRCTPDQLNRQGPLQEQEASGRPGATGARSFSQDRGHCEGPPLNDADDRAVAS